MRTAIERGRKVKPKIKLGVCGEHGGDPASIEFFQSAGLDFRTVALGALLPLLVDLPAGHQAFAHTLLAPVALLALVMLATSGRGHRLLRRRVIGLPIGWFCGLALSGAFASQRVFWWPGFGTGFGHIALLPAAPVVVQFDRG